MVTSPGTPLAPALTYTFQQIAIIVESLLAVALIAGLCIYTLAFLADLCPEQYAFVDICESKGSGRTQWALLYLEAQAP